MEHANSFLESGAEYDMFFLGYTPAIERMGGGFMSAFNNPREMRGEVSVYKNSEQQCVYQLRRWLCTQSYVISNKAMARWQHLKYDPVSRVPIDAFLSSAPGYANSSYFALRPVRTLGPAVL